MDNEIYKQHGFSLHVRVCLCCAFCNGFGNNDTSQEIYMSTNHLISWFVCTSYIGAFFIQKSPWSCLFPWFWNLGMKRNIPKRKVIFCDKFVETRCSMIIISCTCDSVNSYQFCYMNIFQNYFILFRSVNFEAYKVCKA